MHGPVQPGRVAFGPDLWRTQAGGRRRPSPTPPLRRRSLRLRGAGYHHRRILRYALGRRVTSVILPTAYDHRGRSGGWAPGHAAMVPDAGGSGALAAASHRRGRRPGPGRSSPRGSARSTSRTRTGGSPGRVTTSRAGRRPVSPGPMSRTGPPVAVANWLRDGLPAARYCGVSWKRAPFSRRTGPGGPRALRRPASMVDGYFAGRACQPPQHRTALVPVTRRAAPCGPRLSVVPGGSPDRPDSSLHGFKSAGRSRDTGGPVSVRSQPGQAGKRHLSQPARK